MQVRSNQRRIRNVLIGAAIGAVVGLAVDQRLGRYLRNETGDGGTALSYSIPIALCAGVGAWVPGYKTIYRAP